MTCSGSYQGVLKLFPVPWKACWDAVCQDSQFLRRNGRSALWIFSAGAVTASFESHLQLPSFCLHIPSANTCPRHQAAATCCPCSLLSLSCAGCCSQGSAAVTIEPHPGAPWHRQDSDQCHHCLPAGQAGTGAGENPGAASQHNMCSHHHVGLPPPCDEPLHGTTACALCGQQAPTAWCCTSLG